MTNYVSSGAAVLKTAMIYSSPRRLGNGFSLPTGPYRRLTSYKNVGLPRPSNYQPGNKNIYKYTLEAAGSLAYFGYLYTITRYRHILLVFPKLRGNNFQ